MLEQRKIQKPYFGTKNVKLVWERLQTLSALISNKNKQRFSLTGGNLEKFLQLSSSRVKLNYQLVANKP